MADAAARPAGPAGKPLAYCCACGARKEKLLLCSGCRAARFCDAACQAAVFKEAHAAPCRALRAGRVPAVLARGATSMTDVLLEPSDARLQRGSLSRVLAACGIPLRLVRTDATPTVNRPPEAALDNQLATFAMIDPASGFAPPAWQQNIGEVLFFREDGLPLTCGHMALIWNFLCQLTDAYGDEGPDAVRRTHSTPAAFLASVCDDIERNAAPEDEELPSDVVMAVVRAHRADAKFGNGVGAAF
jgi:hypothetical protein